MVATLLYTAIEPPMDIHTLGRAMAQQTAPWRVRPTHLWQSPSLFAQGHSCRMPDFYDHLMNTPSQNTYDFLGLPGTGAVDDGENIFNIKASTPSKHIWALTVAEVHAEVELDLPLPKFLMEHFARAEARSCRPLSHHHSWLSALMCSLPPPNPGTTGFQILVETAFWINHLWHGTDKNMYRLLMDNMGDDHFDDYLVLRDPFMLQHHPKALILTWAHLMGYAVSIAALPPSPQSKFTYSPYPDKIQAGGLSSSPRGFLRGWHRCRSKSIRHPRGNRARGMHQTPIWTPCPRGHQWSPRRRRRGWAQPPGSSTDHYGGVPGPSALPRWTERLIYHLRLREDRWRRTDYRQTTILGRSAWTEVGTSYTPQGPAAHDR